MDNYSYILKCDGYTVEILNTNRELKPEEKIEFKKAKAKKNGIPAHYLRLYEKKHYVVRFNSSTGKNERFYNEKANTDFDQHISGDARKKND